ncbi:hypothetical protein LshimejAT787_0705810 [Lyophyllum shimeji]|uniref:Uncharacterized protein n=1 Tax=Lyophyllum shimeji TaxID=47721 RepID=A0A9P3PQT9_LYOSH|nr:hypothetical protein LshimejAT787_0705810 [Lyophyllum shimeji]
MSSPALSTFYARASFRSTPNPDHRGLLESSVLYPVVCTYASKTDVFHSPDAVKHSLRSRPSALVVLIASNSILRLTE